MSNPETKTDETERVEKFAGIFKALSNPHRLRILLELANCPIGGGNFSANVDEMKTCQREFATRLGLAPSTVSHHFKELRQAGLLKMRREGQTLIVQVDKEILASVKTLF